MMKEVKLLASELVCSMNTRNIEKLDALLGDEISLNYPGIRPIQGRRRVLIFFKKLLSNFDYLLFEQVDIICEDESACLIWENRGCRKDGSSYSNKGVTLIGVGLGKIVYLSDYFKFEVVSCNVNKFRKI